MIVTNPDLTRGRVDTEPQLKGIDYIELYVGNAHQAAHFYRAAFGFTPVAYAGPETGAFDRVSFVIQQEDIRLILTSAIDVDHAIAQHIGRHGDGVKDIAFRVGNAASAFEQAVAGGAQPLEEPAVFESQDGQITRATVGVYGDTQHSFIQRDGSFSTWLPNYQAITNQPAAVQTGLHQVDHVAICVEIGGMDRWVSFYKEVLGFEQLHEEVMETEYSAMNSKAVQTHDGCIKFVVIEPAASKRQSQIEQYLSSYRGAGTQHIALLSDDIVRTIRTLQANGIEFRRTPGAYYERLESRVGKIGINVDDLRELNILVDRDDWGYLLQIFAKYTQSRPTLFCEIIQRKGARGFGSGNIKALFESIERDQVVRRV